MTVYEQQFYNPRELSTSRLDCDIKKGKLPFVVFGEQDNHNKGAFDIHALFPDRDRVDEKEVERRKNECILILDVFWKLYWLSQKQNAPKGFSDIIAFPGFDRLDPVAAAYHHYAHWLKKITPYEKPFPPRKDYTMSLGDYRTLIQLLEEADFFFYSGDGSGADMVFDPGSAPTQDTFDKLTEIFKQVSPSAEPKS